MNKVISNTQGYKWDNHTDSIVPSSSPHDLEPVVFFDTSRLTNKVISDKLGYQMYEMARTASTTDIDVSGARFFSEQVNVAQWSASGSEYYRDLRHNFNNYFVIVRLYDINNYEEERPKRVEAISPNYTRIWVNDNTQMRISIFG